MTNSSQFPLVLDSPVMSQEKFAEKLQLTPGVVRGLVQTKQLPTKKIGRYRFINIAALTAECLTDLGINPTVTEE
jgi:hypothetical protein